MKHIHFSSLIMDILANLGTDQSTMEHHAAYPKIHEGRYLYNPQDIENYIFRSGDYQVDRIERLNLRLISEVIWISEIEYKLILRSINRPELSELKVGDELNAVIVEITDDYYIAETTFKGQSKRTQLWFAS